MQNVNNMKRIYLDHAATTPVDPQVHEAMNPFFHDHFGNASSLHQEGRHAKKAIDQSRATIASFLNAQPQEIIFTSSGTHSCNLAIIGAARANKQQGSHVITTAVEHDAVLASCKALEREGFTVTYLPVDEDGLVSPQDVAQAIQEDTILVSVIFANNEVGSVNPVKEITRAVKKVNNKVLVHSDACQAAASMKLDVKSLNLDLLTINASKIYGPKGIGALYVKKETAIEPITFGGGQEFGLASGTLNTANIVGFAKAIELLESSSEQDTGLRDYFFDQLRNTFPEVVINGHLQKRLVNNINISLPGLDGETLVIYLDQKGIACSTGAACTTSKTDPSHVLLAMGRSESEAKSSLRFTLGKSSTKEDIDYTIKVLKESVTVLKK